MTKLRSLFILFVCTILFGGSVLAQPDSTIIKNAMEEGQLIWYSSAPRYASTRILYEFEERYPFIDAQLGPYTGSSQIQSEFEHQVAVDSVQVDVLHLSLPIAMMQWKEDGHLLKYNSPEYTAYPPEYKSDGWWASARNITVCIAYNSQRVAAEDAPRTWLDLLDEKWKGKLIMGNPSLYGTRQVQYYALRELYKDIDFWKQIAEHTVKVEFGSQMREFFKDPETPVSVTYLGYFYDQYSIKKGEPIRAVWPEDGVPLVPSPIGIAKDAPHPNAARLFIDFILSREGQALLQVLAGDYSVRDDVAPMPGKVPFNQLNVIKTDWRDFERTNEECLNEFLEYFSEFLVISDEKN